MTPHADLFASHGIPVILYDQIGGGESSHYRDAPKEFWTVELFMDELENLLNHFGISGDYDLVGHSWGGMLAANFAAARQPVGLKHLVVADTPASMALWEQSTASLVEQLPQDVQDVIKKHETAGTTDTPEYQEAMLVFYKKHVCRLETWPDALNASFAAMEADPTVYHTMQGPSEFTITGTLKTWNIIDILPNIKVSTLIINSVYDEAQDICMLPFFNNIPKVKWVQFANSSHVPLFEEPERYKKVVGDFLMTA
ncbi:L-amino acid amidase [Termitomyces sp. J132]|nr:L-amino acid amidase [Termitomyces sp. J132]